MANIYEITCAIIARRGEVKAAQIKSNRIGTALKVGHSQDAMIGFVRFLEHLVGESFTGVVWFQSGSYAYLGKDGAGYYWNFVQVPEIPEELR